MKNLAKSEQFRNREQNVCNWFCATNGLHHLPTPHHGTTFKDKERSFTAISSDKETFVVCSSSFMRQQQEYDMSCVGKCGMPAGRGPCPVRCCRSRDTHRHQCCMLAAQLGSRPVLALVSCVKDLCKERLPYWLRASSCTVICRWRMPVVSVEPRDMTKLSKEVPCGFEWIPDWHVLK